MVSKGSQVMIWYERDGVEGRVGRRYGRGIDTLVQP